MELAQNPNQSDCAVQQAAELRSGHQHQAPQGQGSTGSSNHNHSFRKGKAGIFIAFGGKGIKAGKLLEEQKARGRVWPHMFIPCLQKYSEYLPCGKASQSAIFRLTRFNTWAEFC